jgi:hypothetical protein
MTIPIQPTGRPIRDTGNPGHDRIDGPQAWTTERIRALGPVTDLATAASIFGLSRSTAYELAKRDRFPVSVLRFGTRYRVPVAAILHALHLPAGVDEQADAAPDATT